MTHELVATFSTDTTDDEQVIADIKSVVETVLSYMVDNVDVNVVPEDKVPDWIRSQLGIPLDDEKPS